MSSAVPHHTTASANDMRSSLGPDDVDGFTPLPNTAVRSSIRMVRAETGPGLPLSNGSLSSSQRILGVQDEDVEASGGQTVANRRMSGMSGRTTSNALSQINSSNSPNFPDSSTAADTCAEGDTDSVGDGGVVVPDDTLRTRSQTMAVKGLNATDADRVFYLNDELEFFMNLQLSPMTLLFFVPQVAGTTSSQHAQATVHPHPGPYPPATTLESSVGNDGSLTGGRDRSQSGAGMGFPNFNPSYSYSRMKERAERKEAEYYKEDAGRFKTMLFYIFTWIAELMFIVLTASDIYYVYSRKAILHASLIDEFKHLCKSRSACRNFTDTLNEGPLTSKELNMIENNMLLDMRVQSHVQLEYDVFVKLTTYTIILRTVIIQPLVFFGCTFIMSENFWRKESHLAAAFLYAAIYFLVNMRIWGINNYSVHVYYMIVLVYFTPMRTATVFVLGFLYAASFFIIAISNNVSAMEYGSTIKFDGPATCDNTTSACAYCEEPKDEDGQWLCRVPVLCGQENFVFICRAREPVISDPDILRISDLESVAVVAGTFVFGIVVKFRRERVLRRNFKTVKITKIQSELMEIDEAETDKLFANTTGEYYKLTMKNKLEKERKQPQRRPSDEASNGQGAVADAASGGSSARSADEDYVESYAEVSVIFVEIMDFNIISKHLSPENCVRFLDLFWGAFGNISKRRKVKMIETSGEIFMACAGCPERVKGHADRAALAAFEMLTAVNKVKEKAKKILVNGEGNRDVVQQVQIRIGINTGKIVAGLLDLPTSIRFKLFGDTVNIASKMRGCAPAGRVQVSESTHKCLLLSENRRIAQKLNPIFVFSDVCSGVFTSGGRSYDAYYLEDAVYEDEPVSQPALQTPLVAVAATTPEENLRSQNRGTTRNRSSFSISAGFRGGSSLRGFSLTSGGAQSSDLNGSPRLSAGEGSGDATGRKVDPSINGNNSAPQPSVSATAAGSDGGGGGLSKGELILPVGSATGDPFHNAVSSQTYRRVNRSIINGNGAVNQLAKAQQEQLAARRFDDLMQNHAKLHEEERQPALKEDPELTDFLLRHVFRKLFVRDETELSSEQLLLLLVGTATSVFGVVGFKPVERAAVKNEVSYLVEETWLSNLNFVRIHCSLWLAYFALYFVQRLSATDSPFKGEEDFDGSLTFNRNFHLINCMAVGFMSSLVMLCFTFAGQLFYTHNQVLMVTLLVVQGCSVIAETGLFVPKVGFGSLIIMLMSVFQMQLVFFVNRVGLCIFFVVAYYLAIVQFSTDYGDEAVYFAKKKFECIIKANPRFRMYNPSRVGELYSDTVDSSCQKDIASLTWKDYNWDDLECQNFLREDVVNSVHDRVGERLLSTWDGIEAYHVSKQIVSSIEGHVRTNTNYWQVITVNEALGNFIMLAGITILLIVPYFLADKFERARYNEEIKSKEVKASLGEKKLNKERMMLKILPQSIVDTLAEQNKRSNAGGPSETIISHHYQNVTVMYAGLVGFTKIANDMDPIELITFLRAFFHTLSEEMRGVFAVEFIGGSLLAIAGAPTPVQDPTTTMIKIGLRILHKTKQLSHEIKHHFSVKVGIHSGDVKSGVIGMKMKVPRWNIFGDAVRIAGLMESSCPDGKCHISDAAYNSYREETSNRSRSRGEEKDISLSPDHGVDYDELEFHSTGDNPAVRTALELAGYPDMQTHVVCDESPFFKHLQHGGSHRTSRPQQ